jgi:ribonuclease P protein component
MKLVNSDEFTAVFNHKKRLSSENLFLYYRPNEMGKNRLGFVVPKRIEKLAVRTKLYEEIAKGNLQEYF